MNRNTLIDKRAGAWTAATAILDTAEAEGRELTPAEQVSYRKFDAEFDAITKLLEDERPSLPDSPSTRSADHRDAPETRAAFTGWMRGRSDETELRAAGIGTGSAGGYLVPQGFRAKIIDRMKATGGVRSVAEILTTDNGNDLPFPTNDDTGNVGVILAENTQMAEQDVTIGTATLKAYTYSSKLVRVSLQLLQDDAVNFDAWLSNRLGLRIARGQNAHFTTGTGSAQPQGIVTGATSGVTAASVTDVTYDELVDLQHSVDPAYREVNARWMMSDTAWKQIRKLKDSDGRPLVEPDVKSGTPNTLLGSPVTINNEMAVPAAGVKSILFGDFQAGYVIRDVTDTQLLRFNERYGDYLQVGFTAFHRSDGLVQDANAYRALTQAAS